MAVKYSIFPSVNEDRVYLAEDFLARPDRDFLTNGGDGVSREVGNRMEVTETTPLSLAVNVSTGSCRGQGWRCEVVGSAETVSLSTADPNDDRADRIVVEFDHNNRLASLKSVDGTPGSNPSPPALVRTSNVYQISLATVVVASGASGVGNSEISDTRGDADVCGWLGAYPGNQRADGVELPGDATFDASIHGGRLIGLSDNALTLPSSSPPDKTQAVVFSDHANGGTVKAPSGTNLNGVDGGLASVGENEAYPLVYWSGKGWFMFNVDVS